MDIRYLQMQFFAGYITYPASIMINNPDIGTYAPINTKKMHLNEKNAG